MTENEMTILSPGSLVIPPLRAEQIGSGFTALPPSEQRCRIVVRDHKYVFEPKGDITAYEIVKVAAAMAVGNMRPREIEWWWDNIDEGTRRHFREES